MFIAPKIKEPDQHHPSITARLDCLLRHGFPRRRDRGCLGKPVCVQHVKLEGRIRSVILASTETSGHGSRRTDLTAALNSVSSLGGGGPTAEAGGTAESPRRHRSPQIH